MSDDKQRLEAIADAAAPAPVGLRRDHEIRRAIDAGLAAPVPRARRAWPWAVVGAATVAAAAIAIWLVARPGSEGSLVVERGAIAAPAPGQLVEVAAHDRVVLRTPDESTVEASELTRFARDDRAATRWRLDRGHLASHVTKRAPGQTFEVATAEATVAVVGTRFSVDRAVIDGVATTQVRVDEGIVRVTPVGGAPVLLHAGEQWPAPTRTAANAAGNGSSNTGLSDAASDNGGSDTGSSDSGPSNSGSASSGSANSGLASSGSASSGSASSGSADNGASNSGSASSGSASSGSASSGLANAGSSGSGSSHGGSSHGGSSHGGTSHTPPPARPARPFDATAIRQVIRAGNVGDARHLIEAGRKTAHAAPDLAELGILAAEAELADRATRHAIELYLAVVRDYPATAQAEQALFAAAQLAFDRPDAGYRPAAILRDYLDTYPRGQFAGDAKRLLDRAKN